jgi:multidrug transporter EmrE-like cation transporter
VNRSPPPAVTWFKVYAGAMALLCLGMFIGGIAILNIPADGFDPEAPFGDDERLGLLLYGWGFTLFGLPLTALFAAGLFAKPTRFWWIVGIVLIALGLTSVCCLPFSIPLLLFWLKPDVKEWFNAASRPRDDVF